MNYDSVALSFLNRGLTEATSLAKDLTKHWEYDLYARRPGPAILVGGNVLPTDLDLACFLSALADRNAVINIPRYESRRAKTTRSNETVTSSANRHGHVVGLTANQEVFSFSIRIKDENVIVDGQKGGFRNFMLVDFEGNFYEGWDRIEFSPTAKENSFLNDKKLWTGNTIFFKNFVHPNRWYSFFGSPYITTKIACERLAQEAAFYRKEAKRIKSRLELPPSASEEVAKRPTSETAESEPIKVKAFEVEVDAPFHGEFKLLDINQKNYELASERARMITFQLRPPLVFACRATELAVWQMGSKQTGISDVKIPSWSKAVGGWNDYKAPRSPTTWQRLEFPNDVFLKTRTYEKTERVAI